MTKPHPTLSTLPYAVSSSVVLMWTVGAATCFAWLEVQSNLSLESAELLGFELPHQSDQAFDGSSMSQSAPWQAGGGSLLWWADSLMGLGGIPCRGWRHLLLPRRREMRKCICKTSCSLFYNSSILLADPLDQHLPCTCCSGLYFLGTSQIPDFHPSDV